jgi:hypothetical protein
MLRIVLAVLILVSVIHILEGCTVNINIPPVPAPRPVAAKAPPPPAAGENPCAVINCNRVNTKGIA